MYKLGYGPYGKTSWMYRWLARNSYTLAEGSTALGISEASMRKHVVYMSHIPTRIVLACAHIDRNGDDFENNKMEWVCDLGVEMQEMVAEKLECSRNTLISRVRYSTNLSKVDCFSIFESVFRSRLS